MFDIKTLFASQHPQFVRKHPLLTSVVVSVSRWLWKEKLFKDFVAAHPGVSNIELIRSAFEYINFDALMTDQDLSRIPPSGPALIVANHPLGYLDGMGLLKAVTAVRPDCRVLLNNAMYKLLNMPDYTIPVDSFNSRLGKQAFREIRQHLLNGGVLIVFPSGMVSRFVEGHVSDLPWNPSFFRLATQYNAPIVPVYITGRNSLFYYLMSIALQPFIYRSQFAREVLMMKLMREIFSRQRNRRIHLHCGEAIDAGTVDRDYQTLDEKIAFVRRCVYALKTGAGQ